MKRTPFAHIFILIAFLINTFGSIPSVQAQEFKLPVPGVMVQLSPEFNPPILKGIKVHPDNPFRFDFILDKGDSQLGNTQLKDESTKLIKYFLASLTIPEKDLWVNLSPYEKDRIVPESFGLTEMGRDLLAEDYMLKQITASLIYPEDKIGKKFWKQIYEEAQKRFGTTNIPVNTFNKVWIVPEKAVVYENSQTDTAYVVESKLKVMLEQDYLSLEKHTGIRTDDSSSLGSKIVREIVIPELTKEVNEGKNFAKLRQVYNSLILATWYKKKIKDSILSQVYEDKNKTAGVNIADPQEKEKIYQRYLQAFKKGVYNYIKEEQDPLTQETMPRKYFSGGVNFFGDLAMSTVANIDRAVVTNPNVLEVTTDFVMASDRAMKVSKYVEQAVKSIQAKVRIQGNGLDIKYYRKAKSLGNPIEKNFTIIDKKGRRYKIEAIYSPSLVLKYKGVEFLWIEFSEYASFEARIIDVQTGMVGLNGRGIYKAILGRILKEVSEVNSAPANDEFTNTIYKDFGRNEAHRAAHSILRLTLLGRVRPPGYILQYLEYEDEYGGILTSWNSSLLGHNALKINQLFEEAVKAEEAWNPDPRRYKINKIRRALARSSYPTKKPLLLLIEKFKKAKEGILKELDEGVLENFTIIIDQQIDRLNELVKIAPDFAMNVKQEHKESRDLGGIDFTANKTPFEIKNSGEGIKFHLDPAMLAQLQNAPGFVPVIINIQPMTNLRQFLGLKNTQQQTVA